MLTSKQSVNPHASDQRDGVRETPSANNILPLRHSDFSSLVEALGYAAQGETGFNFYDGRGRLSSVMPYRALAQSASGLAQKLAGLGLSRGSRVALIAETSPSFITTFFACQYAGLVPVPLPLCINFGGHDAYRERLAGMIEAAGAKLAVASDAMMDHLSAAAELASVSDILVLSDGQLDDLPAADRALTPLGADDVCYIQYSSGSTNFPRGVLVTQKALMANARSIGRDGLQIAPGDRGCSWLPLYHDMGLVGCCLTPVANQVSVDFMATTTFAKRPLLWLDLISRNRATIAFGPTFGYELCSKRASRGLSVDLDLSSWRAAGIGGEMIRPKALREFAETFADSGFTAEAFLPSYGMAETTLAVTFNRLSEGVVTDRILRGAAYEAGEARQADEITDKKLLSAREFAFCGRPMPGYKVEVRDVAGRVVPDRQIGRIFISAPSMMQGYFNEAEMTANVLKDDGWLNSGDLGYMIDGQLVVTGRSKDLIIVGGRNIWPQDIEWAAECLDDVRTGDSAAFAITDDADQERAVVVAECRLKDAPAREELRQAIRATIQKAVGVECQVVLAAPKSLTFTTSGKLSRAAVKAAYELGEITDLAAADIALVAEAA